MPKKEPRKDIDEKFKHLDRKVIIRTDSSRTELVIDDDIHEVRFLKNGRPYTRAYVNVMASSVRDYAERFIQFSIAQKKHWAEIRAAREKAVCD